MTSAIRAQREAEHGFTLIELLVVVIIIGILAAIAIPAFLNQRERAWQSELTSSVRNVALEVEARATASGGNYVTAFTDEAGLQTFLTTEVQALQGGATPVSLDAGTPTTTAFSFCGWHAQIDGDGDNTPENDHNVTYSSNAGGVADYAVGACAAGAA